MGKFPSLLLTYDFFAEQGLYCDNNIGQITVEIVISY
jgi:hypothetical protein